ncbi:MAG: AIPR family protein [Planctomycetota bacterium]
MRPSTSPGGNPTASFSFDVDEFRSLPFPEGTGSEGRVKLGTCFVSVDDLPDDLRNWMEVNPRRPRLSPKGKLLGPVARRMVDTIANQPQKFVLKNQGIWLLVDQFCQRKTAGGRTSVEIVLADKCQHGLANGGHTFHAILQARDENKDMPLGAHVRLHLMQGVDTHDIVELAEGLNRSAQVDNASLADLENRFDLVIQNLTGKCGHDQINYKSGDSGSVGIEHILSCMALFDLDRFPDRKKHPHKVFGQQGAVLTYYLHDLDKYEAGKPSVFGRIAPRAHEILVLSEHIQQNKKIAKTFGPLKISKAQKNNRAGSQKFKGQDAIFATGKINVKFMLGWLYPILAAFRANVDREAWTAGDFNWLIDPDKLLDEVAEELAGVVQQAHKDNNGKPAEVGRKDGAYRGCYDTVAFKLAQHGKQIF